ncbi:LacI family DNA-binding transcriptional regulator [Filimonas effusa]|uniref:LacI family transcriptional regulator n=1 Tax=Filimonas effusa TaxID=2508721 RepID=A0A4Q1D552_9BACT|nr:substrate-binding domain-containing protein [Filimonas effusa]RXK83086.1 LacI family transcriptional regulator [Filimonas effusa]
MKRVSIKDIARITGTSPTTVSFVLNGKADKMRISREVADRVIAASRSEGYFPNQVAVSLRTGHTNILGLLVESMGGQFFARLAHAVEKEASLFGYKIVYCSSENDKERGRDMVQMLAQRQMDGYLITPAFGMEEELQWLQKQGKPIVQVDSYLPGIELPYVLVDSYNGVMTGVDHLVANGRRNIAFVTVDLNLVQIHDRENGYRDGLRKYGLADTEAVLSIAYEHVGNENGVKTIADFLRAHPETDALFFATNYLGIMGLEAIVQLKLGMPEDIAILSFDDHDVFRLYPTGISVIEQPIEAIGSTSVQLLMDQLGKYDAPGKGLPCQVKLSPRLVVRQSTIK